MHSPPDFQALTCAQCREGVDLGFDFSMAFQGFYFARPAFQSLAEVPAALLR